MTADGDGFITIYSVDSDGAYFVRMEFEVKISVQPFIELHAIYYLFDIDVVKSTKLNIWV